MEWAIFNKLENQITFKVYIRSVLLALSSVLFSVAKQTNKQIYREVDIRAVGIDIW